MRQESSQNETGYSLKLRPNISKIDNRDIFNNSFVDKAVPRNSQEEPKSSFHPDSKKVKFSKLNSTDYKRHPYPALKHLKELYVNGAHFLKGGEDPKKHLVMMVSKAYDQICVEKDGHIYNQTKYARGFGVSYCEMMDKHQAKIVRSIAETFSFDEKEELTDEVCRLRDTVWEAICKELRI